MESSSHELRDGRSAGARVRAVTAPGPGGVAVLSVSGPGAVDRLRRMFGKELPSMGVVAYGTLSSEGAQLDEVLVIRRGEPSFGVSPRPDVGPDVGLGAGPDPEPRFEVHLHGSPSIVHEVVRLLASPHGAPAPVGGELRPGPGSSESLETRAISCAGRCASAWGARLAMDQARGYLRRALEGILALPAPERPRACGALAKRGRQAARLFTPTVVALTGPVNAGKSTLFNVLMGRDEAVVSDAPGTTRDAISGHGTLGGWPVLFVDTAGERELSAAALAVDPHARIEAQGMGLARRAAARAEVVFAIEPAGPAKEPLALGSIEGGSPAAGSTAEPAGDVGRTVSLRSRADEILGADPAAWPPGFFAAEPEPEHARVLIGRAWAGALGLEASAAEFSRAQMGLGVPFELELVARLEALGEGGVLDRATGDGASGAAGVSAVDLGL